MVPLVFVPAHDRPVHLQRLLDALRDEPCAVRVGLNRASHAVCTETHARSDAGEIEVVDYGYANLHHMWNDALEDVGPDQDVVLLNDDVLPYPGFIEAITRDLRDERIGAVCGNPIGYEDVFVCENLGSQVVPGFFGFGFALPAGTPYRFPDWLDWWCGDLHLLFTMQLEGKVCILAPDARMIHSWRANYADWQNSTHAEAVQADIEKMQQWVSEHYPSKLKVSHA